MLQYFKQAVQQHPKLQLAGATGSYLAALELIATKPDVLLVDLGLPDGNGIDLIKQLKTICTDAEAIVVTVFAEEEKVIHAIQAGATSYILKDTMSENISETIIDVMNGISPISPSISRYILNAARQVKESSNPSDTQEILTTRETEVLQLIARGYSRKEIAQLLALSMHTIVAHIRHIYKKLEVHSQNEAVYEAFHHGLIKLDN